MVLFYDLNVPLGEALEGDPTLPARLCSMERLGYNAVALTQRVEGRLPKTPCSFSAVKTKVLAPTSKLRVYTRLTLILSDPQQNYGINSGNEVVRSYDILAVQPETEKMFISACTNLDIDLISLDLSVRLPFPIRAGYLRAALARGISFEITYGPFVADATARRNAIGNARMLLRLALSKRGLVISGAAEAPWQLRAPADVMSLGALLGMPAHMRKHCLTSIPEATFMHAASRKHTFRSAVLIERSDQRGTATEQSLGTDMLEDFIELK